MPEITEYSFGSMTVGGTTVTSDLIILPDGTVLPDWWRQEGHRLLLADLPDVLDASPGILVVGTGASGIMRVSDEVEKECESRGIQLRVLPTAEAVRDYNAALHTDASVAACFHLTC
jgi:hypothetical protein